jgi:prepilin-type N-terminal cleavage/methylation domain-containing protein
MKAQNAKQGGFTLIEMMVVLAILILIASLVVPAVTQALRKGQERKCMANMRSMGQVWFTRYSDIAGAAGTLDTDRIYPWLSQMAPNPIGSPEIFICPSDASKGEDGSKPDSPDFRNIDSNDFAETDDTEDNNHPARNDDITRCSYMYEFSDAECTWWSGYILGPGGSLANASQIDADSDGTVTWGEVKVYQQRYGDTSQIRPGNTSYGYNANQFPIIRCFHHYEDRRVQIEHPDRGTLSQIRVINAAMSGRVFLSAPQWEYPLVQ